MADDATEKLRDSHGFAMLYDQTSRLMRLAMTDRGATPEEAEEQTAKILALLLFQGGEGWMARLNEGWEEISALHMAVLAEATRGDFPISSRGRSREAMDWIATQRGVPLEEILRELRDGRFL